MFRSLLLAALCVCAPAAKADDHALLVFLPGDVDRGLPRILSDDLVALAEVLPRAGYPRANTTRLTNPTAAQLRKALKALSGREKAGRVLVAVVGHATRPLGLKEAHLCPSDGKPGDVRTLVPLADVYRALAGCKAETRLLLLDVCRPVKGPELGEPHAVPVPLGVSVLFTCRAGEQGHGLASRPAGSPAAKGAFLHAVCEALGGKADVNHDGRVSLRELHLYVEQTVPKRARLGDGEKQQPVLASFEPGTLVVGRVVTGPGALGAITADAIDRLPPVKGAGPLQPRITFVFPGGAAHAAGLKAGDVIVSVDGKAIATRAELAAALAGKPVGAKAVLEVLRPAKKAVTVYLEEPRPSKRARLLVTAAREGDAEAMFELRKDKAWLEAAVERRHPMALAVTGRAYLHGEGLPQDVKGGLRLVRAAAEAGLARGQFALAGCFLNGAGVKKDTDEAVKWYKKAAEQGLPDAQVGLGRLFLAGLGVKKDAAEALRLHRLGASGGDAAALFALAVLREQGVGAAPDLTEARSLYQKAAEASHAPAQCRLGQFYHLGKGAPADLKLAVKWYQLAARQGVAIAQYNLGTLYESGKGVEKDLREAHRMYRLAARAGEAKGLAALGRLFDQGKGCEQDHVRAAGLLSQAAEKGHASAQYRLGLMYLSGRGVGQDQKRGVDWLKKAADLGHALAKQKLSDLLAD